jgi:inorganic pyrophosphatase
MNDYTHLKGHSSSGEGKSLLEKKETSPEEAKKLLAEMKKIAENISNGAITFLKQEYTFLLIFIVLFGTIIFFTAEPTLGVCYTTVAFVIGGLTSITAGYIGMRIAVYTNVRTTHECAEDIEKGFIVAYRGGQVLGFVLVSLALLVLEVLILIYKYIYLEGKTNPTTTDAQELFDMLAGYGLGGSTVALFGRVGGGIYTKAADVGSDLAGKVIAGLEEDDKSNPGVVADNVGDNVGDIAGMGSDLFGSLAESTCAALVIGATSSELCDTSDAMYFPLLITAAGIVVSFVTTFFATNFPRIRMDNVESVIKWQLIISTVLMTIAIVPLLQVLPSTFTVSGTSCTPWKAYFCVICGLWSGLIIGWVTEIFTSNRYSPVQELAESCRMGAAPNIILGLALGYMSNIVPIICIAVTIYISFTFAGMYGIALSALGMLGCLPIALAIDGYGPISDNAGGIAEMAELTETVR